MQKLLIMLVVGLLTVGCGQSDTERLEEEKLTQEYETEFQMSEDENKRLEAEIESNKLKALKAETDKTKKEPPANPTDQNTTKAKPVNKLTIEEQIVGEYESIYNGKTYKRVFLKNGIVEWYVNGKKRAEYKLEIVNGEIRAAFGSEYKDIYRINADRSIIHIAYIDNGEREDFPKEEQVTYKRIK